MVGLLSMQGRSTYVGQNTESYENMTNSNTVSLTPSTRHFHFQQLTGMCSQLFRSSLLSHSLVISCSPQVLSLT